MSNQVDRRKDGQSFMNFPVDADSEYMYVVYGVGDLKVCCKLLAKINLPSAGYKNHLMLYSNTCKY